MNTLPQTWTLHNGRSVRWRAVQPDDAPRLMALIASLSPGERRARFHCGINGLPAAEMQRLCSNERPDQLAGVVCASGADGEAIVAEARCSVEAALGRAELALMVAPAWRRLGLATRCLHVLHDGLVHQGVQHWRASVQADNVPMRALLEHFEFTRQWHGAEPGCVLYARALQAAVRRPARAWAGAGPFADALLRRAGWST